MSHGCAYLAPSHIDESRATLDTTLRVGAKRIELHIFQDGEAIAVSTHARLGIREERQVETILRRMFRLDQDLSQFYARINGDPMLAWAAAGAGRLLASPTIFEDVVKTICTTNCAWSGTERMTDALVQLGGGAFPAPEKLADTPDAWFRDVARMGYRAPYVKQIAQEVAGGSLDFDRMVAPSVSDDDAEEALLDLPGVGPYAAAHIMQLIGRHRRLVLDSWTRPKFLSVAKMKRATDNTIRRTFAKYGDFAGLAFWLYLTKDWLND